MPAPSVPTCATPLSFAFVDTFVGSASFRLPFASQYRASSSQPNPLLIDHLTPSARMPSNSLIESLIFLLEPRPLGTLSNISCVRTFIFSSTSFLSRLVVIILTPQLMSYPTPPGLRTPSS